MTCHNTPTPSQPLASRSGIALVVVLGMLSVIVLLGVAFAISMRTERLAANAFVDVVRARTIMDGALTRVMTDHLPNAAPGFYPNWLVHTPSGGDLSAGSFMAARGIDYVPGALRPAANAGDEMRWQDMLDPQGNFHGQYAYMIVNMSGLLDANHIDKEDRAYGGSPGEIQFSDYIFDSGEVGSGSLRSWRDDYFIRFETVPELFALGTWNAANAGSPNLVSMTESPPFTTGANYVDHFHIFSRFPDTSYAIEQAGQAIANPKALIGGDPNFWEHDDIVSVLMETPALFDSQADAQTFVNLLHDFADESYVPQNPGGLSFKRVPMINEVVMSNVVERRQPAEFGDPDIIAMQVHLSVETWFPFDAQTEYATVEVTYSEDTLTALVGPPIYGDLGNFELINVEQDPEGPHSENDFRVTRFIFESSMPASPWPEGLLMQVTLSGNLAVELTSDGSVVNQVNGPWPANTFQFSMPPTFPFPAYDSPVSVGQVRAYSTDDPRFNWDTANAASSASGQWRPQAETLGGMNAGMGQFSEDDEVGLMYVAQREFINAGEVSYLPYSGNPADPFQPWRTARLIGPDPNQSARIIDRLSTATNPQRRGKANINSPFTNVVRAAIFGAPREEWPGMGGIGTTVTRDQAGAIAGLIYEAFGNLDTSTDFAMNMSDLVNALDTSQIGSILGLGPADNNKFIAESPIRNSMGTLGTRDTLYTVFLATRTLPVGLTPDDIPSGESLDDYVAAEQRAVAVVWRDPYRPTLNGPQQTIIRTFNWLLEED